jgi:hypothetical protein
MPDFLLPKNDICNMAKVEILSMYQNLTTIFNNGSRDRFFLTLKKFFKYYITSFVAPEAQFHTSDSFFLTKVNIRLFSDSSNSNLYFPIK